MSDEIIVIEIQDKIDASILKKLRDISTYAVTAADAIVDLSNAEIKAAIGAEKLKQAQINTSTAMQKLATATAIATGAQQKLVIVSATASNDIARKNLDMNNKIQRQHALTNSKIVQDNFVTHERMRNVERLTTAKIIAEVKKIENAKLVSMSRIESRQSRAIVSSPATSATAGVGSGMRGVIAPMLAAAGAYVGVREIVELGDAYTGLRNKLKVVTTSEEQLNQVSKQMFNIANETRTSVEETATAFSRFDRALAPLGKSQADVLLMTETINKALTVSGASTGEAKAGLLQLSQAFNKGKLDGDEFRSVMELMPSVADAIAKELKVAGDKLLLLAPQGKITAEVMSNALSKAALQISAEFSKTTPTVSQSMEIMRNSAIESFGEIEKSTGLLKNSAEFLITFSKNINYLSADISILANTVTSAVVSFSPLVSTLSNGISVIDVMHNSLIGASLGVAHLTDFYRNLAIVYGKYMSMVSFGDTSKMFSKLASDMEASGSQVDKLNLKLKENQKEWYLTKRNIADRKEITDAMQEIENSYLNIDKSIKSASKTNSNFLKTKEGKDKEAEIKSLTATYESLNKELLRLSGSGALRGIGASPRKSVSGKAGKVKEEKENTSFEDDFSSFWDKRQNAMDSFIESLEDERRGLSLVGDAQAANNIVTRQADELRKSGWALTQNDIDAMTTERMTLIELSRVQQASITIWNANTGAAKQFEAELIAISKAINGGVTESTALMGSKYGEMFAGTETALQAEREKWKNHYKELAKMLEQSTISEADKIRAKANLNDKGTAAIEAIDENSAKKRLGQASQFFGNMSTLQKQGSRESFEIGKQMALAQATISGISSVMNALEVKPYPVGVALAIGAGVAAGANIAAIANTQMQGFEVGGYTGNGGRSSVAGVVHGQEFVVNAAATAQNRPVLEAMNAGKSSSSSVGTKAQVSVKIENYGTSKDFEVQQTSEGELRIIARDEIRKHVPGLMASEIANSNSKVSKSLSQNTQTSRRF